MKRVLFVYSVRYSYLLYIAQGVKCVPCVTKSRRAAKYGDVYVPPAHVRSATDTTDNTTGDSGSVERNESAKKRGEKILFTRIEDASASTCVDLFP